MNNLFAIFIITLILLWGFSISSNAGVDSICPGGPACPANNWCCPAGTLCNQQGIPASARCSYPNVNPNLETYLENGACCLDGTFLPNSSCSCNEPPDCTNATADVELLWPPNHKYAEISVVGVTDPEEDQIIITIDSIDQDEPVVSATDVGAGNSCPDATGVGTSFAQVRAERSGNKNVPGDGRVYHIGFTADDGHGGTCTGTVHVCVPHDKSDTSCIDGGALYDSTVCNGD